MYTALNLALYVIVQIDCTLFGFFIPTSISHHHHFSTIPLRHLKPTIHCLFPVIVILKPDFFFFLENIDSDKKVLLLKRDAAHPAYKRLINYYSTLIISGLRFKSMSFKGHYCFICQQLLFGRVFTWEQRSPSFFIIWTHKTLHDLRGLNPSHT